MRRQFLRVYIGIAVVLLLAGLTMTLLVGREVQRVVDGRIEGMVAPWAHQVRQRLKAVTPAARPGVVARLAAEFPFPVELVRADAVNLGAAARQRLDDGDAALVRRGDDLRIYLDAGDGELIVVGPVPTPGNAAEIPPGRWPSRPVPTPGNVPGIPPGRSLSLQKPHWQRPPLPPAPSGLGMIVFHGNWLLLGSLLVILTLIGAAVYVLLRPFERRIDALAVVARAFGNGDLSRRSGAGGGDAIGRLALTFDDMAERIERLIERQRDLLRAVSHELRTPLARLFFLVDDARATDDREERDRVLGRAEKSLEELNDLVEELLTFERLDRQEEPAREVVDLAPLLAGVAQVIGDLHPALGVCVTDGGLQARAVPRLLRRAILNLATNAARHARERVVLGVTVEGPWLCVTVGDDGPGIPAGDRERVFEPFARLDESRTAATGGTGLGLAIVQRIAQLHGGNVAVGDSHLGGARFDLRLPR